MALLCFFVKLNAQAVYTAVPMTLSSAQSAVLTPVLSNYECYQIDPTALKTIMEQEGDIGTIIFTLGNNTLTFSYEKRELSSPDFVKVVETPQGAIVSHSPDCVTYAGQVNGATGMKSTMTLSDSWFSFLYTEGGISKTLYPSQLIGGSLLPSDCFLLYANSDASESAFVCGYQDVQSLSPTNNNNCAIDPIFSNDPALTEPHTILIGYDADQDLSIDIYNSCGGCPNYLEKVSGLISATNSQASEIYAYYFNTYIAVAVKHIYDIDTPDNYNYDSPNENDVATNLLQQLVSNWSENPDLRCAERDAIFLFSGRALPFAGVVPNGATFGCGNVWGNEARSTPGIVEVSSSSSGNTKTLAHELGHLLGCGHTFADEECEDNCGSSSFQSIMCYGDNGSFPVFEVFQQSLIVESLIQKTCLLDSNQPSWDEIMSPPPCIRCTPSIVASTNTLLPVINCSEEDEEVVELSFTVCNNCYIDRTIYMSFHDKDFATANLTLPFGFTLIQSLSDQSAIANFYSSSAHFEPDECQTFTFTFTRTSLNSFSQIFVFSPNSDPNGLVYYGTPNNGNFFESVVFPYVVEITATDGANLSDLNVSDQCIADAVATVIRVEGQLTLDESTCFGPATQFLMMPGASLIVQSGKHIEMNGTQILGCDKMWRGITVNKVASLTMTDCSIKDAARAVTFVRGSWGALINNTFDQNDVGIYTPEAVNGIPTFVNLVLDGNIFLCSEPLKALYDGQPPHLGKGFAGMYLQDVPAQNISGGSATGLLNGIVAYRSNLLVKDMAFGQMSIAYPMTGYPNGVSGNGIYVEGAGLLDQYGFGPNGAASFDMCTWGIRSVGTSLNIRNNRMLHMGYGVQASLTNEMPLTIADNHIEASQSGIYSYMNTHGKDKSLLHYNDVVVTGGGAGIRIADVPFNTYGWRIDNNTINVKGGGGGIYINASPNNIIDNNPIILGAQSLYGIEANAAHNNVIGCNTITGVPNTNPLIKSIGIRGFGNAQTSWECNNTFGMDYGTQMIGMADQTTYQGNNAAQNSIGILLGLMPNVGDAILSPQKHKANTWAGGFSDVGAKHYSDDPTTVNYSQFVVDDVENPLFLTTFTAATNDWFDPENDNLPSFSCFTSACPYNPLIAIDDDFDVLIADGKVTGDAYREAMQWQAKRHLQARLLLRDGNTMPTKLFDFRDSTERSPIGQLSQWRLSLATAKQFSTTELQTLTEKLDSITLVLTNLAAIDSVWLQNQNTGYLATRETAATLANNAAATLLTTLDASQTRFATDAAVLDVDNRDIVPEVIPELIEQQANMWLLDALLGREISDTVALIMAAHSCPLEGGEAVFIARQILNERWGYRIYDDTGFCRPATSLRSFECNSLEYDKFVVSPNPARDILTATFPFVEEGDVLSFTMSDMFGRVVPVQPVSRSATTWELDISDLPQGLYTCMAWRNAVYRTAKTVLILR